MRGIVLMISILLLAVSCVDGSEPWTDYGEEITIAHLLSMATEPVVKIKHDYTISGDVVANDKLDELRSGFVLTDDTGGVEIAVESRDVDLIVPLFSRAKVRCSGLCLGRVGGKVVVGVEPTGRYAVDRISEAEVMNYVSVDTTVASRVVATKRRISDLGAADMLRYLRIDSLSAVERGYSWADVDTISGGHITTIRHFTFGGDTLRVVIDGDCDYADHKLPQDMVVLRGILDWYDGAAAFRVSNHAITLLGDSR